VTIEDVAELKEKRLSNPSVRKTVVRKLMARGEFKNPDIITITGHP